MKKPTVTIIQRRLTHYRVPLFEGLRESLDRLGISLRLLHGEGRKDEGKKNDAGNLDWAEPLRTRYILADRLCWQPFTPQVAGSSLLIVTQENAMLANHLALLRKPVPKLAFWGHGANLQGSAHSVREKYKRWSTRQVDWYFAYTSQSVDLVTNSGFPRSRTTRLDNAIDVDSLKEDIAAIENSDLSRLRVRFGLEVGPVGLFLGSLYAHKRLKFLLRAAERLRSEISGFQLLVVGDGPGRSEIEAAATRHSWIRYVGSQKGRDKAGVLRLASINMNPGLVGLGILDSFAGGVPLVTTDCKLHSPEIAYLSPDNGRMTADDLESYVAACAQLLTDRPERDRLAAGCRAAALRYTLPNMVEKFTLGIHAALQAPPR